MYGSEEEAVEGVLCLRRELGDVAWDYCLSCVHQIISVVRISSMLVIAPLPPPLTHPRSVFVKRMSSGTFERRDNPSHPVEGEKGRENPIASS